MSFSAYHASGMPNDMQLVHSTLDLDGWPVTFGTVTSALSHATTLGTVCGEGGSKCAVSICVL